MNENDPRSLRSTQSMKTALIYLLGRKDYDKISINDIVERAGLARPTFYLHFVSKDQLLISCYEDLSERILKKAKKLHRKETLIEWRAAVDTLLLQELDKNRILMDTIYKKNLDSLLTSVVMGYIAQLFPEHLAFHDKTLAENILKGYIRFYSGGYVSMLKCALSEGNAFKPEQMGNFFFNLTNHFLDDILMNDPNLQDLAAGNGK